MIEAILQRAVRRFSRRVEDLAVDVEEPAVIATPQPLVTDQAKLQGRAAMGTVELKKAYCAAPVAKGHQVLTEDAQTPRQVLHFLRGDNGLPKASQVLAAGRRWSHLSELGVPRRLLTMVIRAVGRVEKRYSCRHHAYPPRGTWPQCVWRSLLRRVETQGRPSLVCLDHVIGPYTIRSLERSQARREGTKITCSALSPRWTSH
jgi:hypothetical protein